MLSWKHFQRKNFHQSRHSYTLTWIIIYTFTLALASSIFFYDIPLPDKRLTLNQVEFAVSDAEQPDDIPHNSWAPAKLPDSWKSRNLDTMNVWYRGSIDFESTPNQLWAILIPAVKMNAAVFLNGHLLSTGGRFTDPVARNWMTPLLFSIPSSLLHEGSNTFHIRVKSDPPGTGQLSALQLAPYEDLLKPYTVHYMLRITSIQIITTMLLVMGGLIGMLWLVRRKETYYGYYALAVIIWGIHNFNIFTINIPVSTRPWDWFAYVTIGYYTFLALVFTHRFLDKHHPKIEKTVLSVGLSASFLLLFLNDEQFYFAVYNLWYPAIFNVGFYILSYTCIEAWKRKSIELQFLTATGGITLLYAMHDLLLMHGYVNWEDGYFIQYAAAVLLTLFSFILLRRFAHSLNDVDALNLSLEKRVEEKRLQLEKNYLQLQHMENERILAKERERLTREIHDGMGGHLVSTLAMIESGKADLKTVGDAIKDSLNDLRMMIDSMDIAEDDLPTLLGMFRMRITPRLNNSSLGLEWHIDDIPPIPDFGPREALHVLRILQEAITNVIKHARANTVRLSTRAQQQSDGSTMVVIELSDNGSGLPSQAETGNGLKNMQFRASQIGAHVEMDSDVSGTRMRLMLPA